VGDSLAGWQAAFTRCGQGLGERLDTTDSMRRRLDVAAVADMVVRTPVVRIPVSSRVDLAVPRQTRKLTATARSIIGHGAG
jgi:hypothetical protein